MVKQEKTLTEAGIVAIIEACRGSKVRVLKYAGLYVSFSREEDAGVKAHPVPPMGTPGPLVAEITLQQKEQAQRAFLEAERDLKEERVAEMWLTDPAQAEKHLINGDFDEEILDGED